MSNEHAFTTALRDQLYQFFPNEYEAIFDASPLIQYINIKTRSASRGSKARGSFANLYAVYVLIEDYLNRGFHNNGGYRDYPGAQFTYLFKRQRELPFGRKLQNHALNSRMNLEFHKYFPQMEIQPIIRDENNRYCFNEQLLKVRIGGRDLNIAEAVIAVIDAYVDAKRNSFLRFIDTFESIKHLEAGTDTANAVELIIAMLAPEVDARIFEIVSYGILKYHYHDQVVFFGFDLATLERENLALYKTGRTNANDGGIDFVMRPLGRFFQVTETTDVRKYFLDIDKLQRFPVTFVVKSSQSIETLMEGIKARAAEQYPVTAVVDRYMACIEEIINVQVLVAYLHEAVSKGYLSAIVDEIIRQSKVEFNYDDSEPFEADTEEIALDSTAPELDFGLMSE
jgi:hypothetical protein